jgi:hypothetical protein
MSPILFRLPISLASMAPMNNQALQQTAISDAFCSLGRVLTAHVALRYLP